MRRLTNLVVEDFLPGYRGTARNDAGCAAYSMRSGYAEGGSDGSMIEDATCKSDHETQEWQEPG